MFLCLGNDFKGLRRIKQRERLYSRVDDASFIEFGRLQHPKLILCYVNFVPRAKL